MARASRTVSQLHAVPKAGLGTSSACHQGQLPPLPLSPEPPAFQGGITFHSWLAGISYTPVNQLTHPVPHPPTHLLSSMQLHPFACPSLSPSIYPTEQGYVSGPAPGEQQRCSASLGVCSLHHKGPPPSSTVKVTGTCPVPISGECSQSGPCLGTRSWLDYSCWWWGSCKGLLWTARCHQGHFKGKEAGVLRTPRQPSHVDRTDTAHVPVLAQGLSSISSWGSTGQGPLPLNARAQQLLSHGESL